MNIELPDDRTVELDYSVFAMLSPAEMRKLVFRTVRNPEADKAWVVLRNVPDTAMNRMIYDWATTDETWTNICLITVSR